MSKQQNLFTDAADLRWKSADHRDQLIADVVFNRPMETIYQYVVPDAHREILMPGQRVMVPLGRGNQRTVGFCVALNQGSETSRSLKEIHQLVDHQPLADKKMLQLTRWIAEYYLCSWGQVLHAVIPAAVKNQAGMRDVLLYRVPDSLREAISEQPFPAKQQAVINVLMQSAEALPADQITALAHCGSSPLQTLVKKGFVEKIKQRELTFSLDQQISQRQENLVLTADQQAALDAILVALDQKDSTNFLLHGVTGSGKTEVYIRAIQRVVEFGKQAIVLVPEISLTPQTIRRFRQRFDSVAVLHSHLSDAERHWHWQQIAEGRVQVIVGARSAIFAPAPHLGLIIIDEEHETTFKQETTPRYHAREVARQRSLIEQIPLVLGSATPMLESFICARQGNDHLLSLPKRIEELPMPPVVTIDTRYDPLIKRGHNIGRALFQGIQNALNDQGQVILFFNLRGFTPVIWCKSCGEKLCCPHCDTSLTWHKDKKRCLCHTCDYSTDLPSECPSCQQPGLRHFGSGTQRLEDEIRAKFPGVPALRMDSDSMRKPGSHDEALEKFRSGDVSILMGTQMIAKGLDFPNVTLVGVVDADISLHPCDFRSSERTFQLISQVAGRTGRSQRGGRVLVQTIQPDHPAIESAAAHDYLSFARREWELRKRFHMPPHFALARVIMRGTDREHSEQAAKECGRFLKEQALQLGEPVYFLGPSEAPIARLRNFYRFHLQMTAGNHSVLREVWNRALEKIQKLNAIESVIDIDPLQMR